MRRTALWIPAPAGIALGVALVFVYLCVGVVAFAQEDLPITPSDTMVTERESEEDYSNHVSSSNKIDDVGRSRSEEVVVSPVVSNEKAKPRDIIKKELVITNNTAQKMGLYIAVNNIDPLSGDQVATGPMEADLSTSLANWVEITRGVIDLGPNESRKIPYLIHVNLTAKPAAYFARISFHKGSNRAEAEARDASAELILNLEVEDDANERLQLGGFTIDSSVVFGNSADFSYLLENVGNRLVEPRGSIRIFNRRGEEVGSVPLNAEGEEITPENKRQLAAVWNASGRFGKYKAFLDLEYGENQLASVQDTVYFWVFPWKEIMASLMGVFVLAVIGTYVVHMRAMARPSPARAYHLTPSTAPTPSPTQAYAPMQSTQSAPVRASQQTVFLGKREYPARVSVQQTPTRASARIVQGGTVALRGRDARASAQVRGDTVQLASRR